MKTLTKVKLINWHTFSNEEFEIYKNSYINNDSIFKAFNLILVDSNSDSDIKDNIFKIKSNNHGFIASINLWTENYGNKISYNKFIDIEGVSIILDSENIEVINNFLKENDNFELVPIDEVNVDLDNQEKGYLKIYPNIHGMDGFFIAKLKRVR